MQGVTTQLTAEATDEGVTTQLTAPTKFASFMSTTKCRFAASGCAFPPHRWLHRRGFDAGLTELPSRSDAGLTELSAQYMLDTSRRPHRAGRIIYA